MKCVLFSYITLILLSPLYEVSISHSFYCLLFMKCVIFPYHTHFTVSSLWRALSCSTGGWVVVVVGVVGVDRGQSGASRGYPTLFPPRPQSCPPILAPQHRLWSAASTRTHDACYTHTWCLLHAHMALVTRTRDACYTHTHMRFVTHTALVTRTHDACYTYDACDTHTHDTCYTRTWRLLQHMTLVTCTHDTWHSAWQLTPTCDTQHKHERTHDKQQMTLSVCTYVCVCVRMCVCVCVCV